MSREKRKIDDGEKLIIEKKQVKKKRREKKDGARYAIIIYYVGIVAFIVAVMAAVSVVNKEITEYLADYENNLPQYTVEKVFDEYFANPDFSKLIELAECEETAFSDKDDIAKYLGEKVKNKEIKYVYVAGSNKTKVNVKAGNEKFASFTVETENSLSEHGFERYKLGKVKLFYKAEEYVTVTVPFNCSVYVNGRELTDEYITEKDITDDDRVQIPDGTYKLTYKKYELKGLLSEPEVQIKDRDGQTVEADYDSGKKEYSARFEYDEQLKLSYEEYVLKAMKLYACRMQNDASFSQCKGYFEPDTALYEQIRQNPGSFVWDHNGYTFEDEWTGEYYMYSEGLFSCRVKFNHILHMNGKEDHPDLVDLVIYLRTDADGEYKIFAMETK